MVLVQLIACIEIFTVSHKFLFSPDIVWAFTLSKIMHSRQSQVMMKTTYAATLLDFLKHPFRFSLWIQQKNEDLVLGMTTKVCNGMIQSVST